jgi:hypothetical protein
MKTGIFKFGVIVMLAVFTFSSPVRVTGNSGELISSKPYSEKPSMQVHQHVKAIALKNAASDAPKVAKEDVTRLAAPDTAMAGGDDSSYFSSFQVPTNFGRGLAPESTTIQLIYSAVVAGLALMVGIFMLSVLIKNNHHVEHSHKL